MPGPLESRKDVVQEAVESGAEHAGRIATIVTDAVRDIAREAGAWATDVFELREAQDRARRDREDPPGTDVDAPASAVDVAPEDPADRA